MSRYQHVQKLLSKIAVKRFMDNFRRKLTDLDIPDSEFSKMSGRHTGAFNKTINEAEDLRLSSFLRYWYTATSILPNQSKDHEVDFDFNVLMDDQVNRLLFMVKELSPSDLGDNTPNIKSKDLTDLRVYVDLLTKQKAISQVEREAYFKMIEELKEQEGQDEN